MDIASVIGIVCALALLFGSVLIGTAPLSAYFDVPSILMVFGGASATCFTCFPLKTMLSSPKVAMKAIFNKAQDRVELIKQIVSLAETARRDGLLALESRIPEIENPLVRSGIQMAVDGSTPEAVEQVLRTDVSAMAARHKVGKSIMDQMGRFAPAYGMIGTLVGLIMMLGNMSDPSQLSAGMAVTLITTLYGAVAANAFFAPCAEKLGLLSKQEIMSCEIAIRGVMAIQSGESPRVIQQKLNTFLPRKQREGE